MPEAVVMLLCQARRREPEIMDQADLDRQRHWHALSGLRRINRFSGSAAMLWPPLRQLAQKLGRPMHVLDVATGGGDVPIRIWQKARRQNLAVHVSGCDVSPAAVAYAQAEAHKVGAAVDFFVVDALKQDLPGTFDAVVCSLFMHHLHEDDAVRFLGRMAAAARHVVLVNDLRRSLTGWLFAWLGVRLLTRSSVVHVDGPRSVAAAFSPTELLELMRKAGLDSATLCRRWPFRMLATWARP
jgi:SAM-dependent methyltransferase